MRKSLFAASVLLLFLVMTGCRRPKAVVTVPPPPPRPVIHHEAIPHATLADMPVIPASAPPNVVLGGAVAPAPPQRDWNRSQDQRPADNAQASKAAASKSAAAGEEPPTTTPIGQLSAAPNTHGLPSTQNLEQEIHWIQQQLNTIHRSLNPSEQRTVLQIRTFLSKAVNALQAGDLDGANTLTVKARVLLSEIQ